MSKAVAFHGKGLEDYQYWQTQDLKMLKRINLLLKDVERNGHQGIGKPEALKHELQGCWSRRINDEHRLIYSIDEQFIHVYACRYHYDN